MKTHQIAAEAAEQLANAGYIYLGIRDRPKPITGVITIIEAAIEKGIQQSDIDRCANCGQPISEHCKIHLIPCCPGKCVGKK